MPSNHFNEFHYKKTTRFIGLKQEKTFKYLFKELRLTSYGAKITTLTGDCQMKRLTGVKGKEMMVWITLFDVFVDDTKVHRKIYFANLMGFSQSYLVTTVEDEPKKMK
ncbi:hypothetical protein J1N35_041673 [Gossypium stocksii]|uniref:Uncharacterized protein n=1 Tax=Gossypium stocksii TaxID=47602 RepID=A0A9D3UG27_9ROSI|nr:hypothetical protein J1N35_041673 [Gossypium stocksii]